MAHPEDDKTVLATSIPAMDVQKPANGAPPPEAENALPIGTRIGEFELTGLVGIGGFGIVYLAYDHSLERRVALKEYMPSSLAQRTGGSQVSVKSERYAETFTAGMKSFVNEAKLLAQFDHPALVKVYRFWEGNGTAYMVMPYYEGITLKQKLKQLGSPPDETWLKHLLAPLMDALDAIHREQCFHRDIAPDNIMLLKGEKPLLLDFGAARRVIGDMTHALTVILKPGYAPIEQYAEVPGMKQGAFTDVYALGAVIYYAIMGKTPPPSVARMMSDSMVPLAQAAAGRYSEAFLKGVDKCLSVKPEERPQSMTEMRRLLAIEDVLATVIAPAEATVIVPQGGTSAGAGAASGKPATKGPLVAILGAVAALVVGAGVWFALQPGSAPTPSPPPQAEPAPPAEPVPPPRPPFSPVAALDEIFRDRNLAHTVSFAIDRAQVRIGRDKLAFRLRSGKPGYLYVLMVGTDSAGLYLLFPNAVDKDNRVDAGRELALPRSGWSMVAGGPAGTNHFVAVVSENPRDFAGTGLQPVDPFAEFPLSAAQARWASHQGPVSPFLGTATCAAPPCSESYGAAIFTIDEVE